MHSLFITGVSKGLGRELAAQLGNEQTRLFGFSRTRGDFSGRFYACDFSEPQTASETLNRALADANLAKSTRITFIANAGQLGPLDLIENLSTQDIVQNVNVNLVASVIALQQFIDHTLSLKVPKLFVQISSGAALPERVKPSWSLYCASKSGQEQLVRTVAVEQRLQDAPVKVVNFNPGVMETDMQVLIRSTPKEKFPEVDRFIQLRDQGKVTDPSLVARSLSTLIDQYELLESGKTYHFNDFHSNA